MIEQISDEEYRERIKIIQKKLAEEGIDLLIVFGSEPEPQNLLYLSNYWPAFETACILIPVEGESALIIGPESLSFAQDYSKIERIYQVIAHRESAEPNYPDANLDTYKEILNEILGDIKSKKIGLCGCSIITANVYQVLIDALEGNKLINCDHILRNMRMKKSERELNLMKKASEISMKSFEAVLNNIKEGMEEVEVVSYVVGEMFRNKTENLAFTPYILSGKRSRLAIGRASHKKIKKNEPIQFDCGCRYYNYSSCVGRSFSIGKMDEDYKKFIKVGIELHKIITGTMKAGINASEVFKKYWEYLNKQDFTKYFLYGPCHGTGIMECEHPFLESNSTFKLFSGMAFQVDIFLVNSDFGVRIENGAVVRDDGVEEFTPMYKEIIEL